MLDPREMGSDVAHVAARVRDDPRCARIGRRSDARRPADDEAVAVDAAKALAAYLETLVTPRTPFDDFRDALARGDRDAAARYPVLAQRGLAIFVGSGNCTACHGGPRLSERRVPRRGHPVLRRAGSRRSGPPRRHRQVEGEPLQPARARTTTTRPRAPPTSTRHVALDHRNYGEFKVPSLRGVARTAPYMHNGSLATLRDVVRHYSNLDEDRLHADGERILKPLGLDKYDVDALVAFLETL